MKSEQNLCNTSLESRRKFITRLSGMAMLLSCKPLLSLAGQNDSDSLHEKDLFRSFIMAAVPGADHPAIDLMEFYSTAYPFYQYIKILMRDLRKSSSMMFNTRSFEKLTQDQKMAVLSHGCKKPVIGRLYKGGIWFVQVLIFTGLAYKDRYCRIIDFEGNKALPDKETKEAIPVMVKSITKNGNLF